MPLRGDVVCRSEDPLPLLRDPLEAARGSVVVEDLLHEVLPPESLAPRDLLEIVQEVRKLVSVHDTLVPNQTELRLADAGRIGDHGDCQDRKSTRLNSSHVRISYA